MKRKYNSKSILEKYQLLKEIDGGKTAAVVCRERNLSKQTVSNWLKEKAKIYASVDANIVDKKRQRLKSSPFENREKFSIPGSSMSDTRGSTIYCCFAR